MALSLFGVTVNDAHTAQTKVSGIEAVIVRDIVAVCRETEYRNGAPNDEAIRAHSEIVGAYSAAGPILPAPVGVIFRSADSVRRWLELHFSSLTEALTFVENRVGARVHVWARSDAEDVADVASRAAESLRALRRSAVAMVPLAANAMPGSIQSSAYLVEEDLWKDFSAEVEAQGRVAGMLRFEVTGPFPPYDFVRMQLGA